MSKPLCRYCGKTMQIESIDHADVFYECSCNSYKKDIALQKEIRELKWQLANKEEELRNHRNESMYNQKIKQIENELSKIQRSFYQFWTA